MNINSSILEFGCLPFVCFCDFIEVRVAIQIALRSLVSSLDTALSVCEFIATVDIVGNEREYRKGNSMICRNKLNYKDAYYKFMKIGNFEEIKKILREQEYYSSCVIDEIEFRKKDGLPYLYLLLDSFERLSEDACAMVDGIFIDIASIVPDWTDFFYLPVLVIRKENNNELKQFIDIDILEKHELVHINESINYINKNPNYIEEAMKYSVANCSIAEIKQSINFEIRNIFTSELRAVKADYENEDRNILFTREGAITRIPVHNPVQNCHHSVFKLPPFRF